MGYFGLVTDGLISARVVTSTGELVQVSENENLDLFWGMRGAGANLGIITSATFQAHRMADHNDGYVLNADIIFSPNKSAEYFEYLESLENKLPGNVAGIHIMSYNEVTGEVSWDSSTKLMNFNTNTHTTGAVTSQLGLDRTRKRGPGIHGTISAARSRFSRRL